MSEFRHFDRADRIFARALDLDPDDAMGFVAEECGNDGELRAVVEGLLEAARDENALSPGGALQGPVWSGIAEIEEISAGVGSPDAAGEQIGPYRLVRELGRGGMAVVYLAERADGAYEQQVALKLIGADRAGRHVAHRFVQERQILAALDHPNIARLLDGGTTADGRPYLVMEWVDGLPIDRYCDERALGVDERLRLFLRVCAAVQVAHRNLVVHRDLKPNNILVTPHGEPKLLDFGIAKLLEEESGDESSIRTRLHERPMTPQYASPEQILGRPITTATDVYALGLLLYELLTGRRAHRFASTQSRDVERAVCEELPERPSTAVSRSRTVDGEARTEEVSAAAQARHLTPLRLRRLLRGDLDNIVMMALRKESERRYASVEQLAADVERHMDGMPVMAHGDSLLYRTGKLVQRRSGTLVAVALVAASLVSGLIVARRQAVRAKQEARRAEEVSDFLIELFDDADPDRAQGRDVPVQEVLERAARRIEVELAEQPEVQATLETVMGRVYRQLGSFGKAETLLGRALETRRRLFGPDDPEVAATAAEEAHVLTALGRWRDAQEMAHESLSIRRRRLGPRHPEVAESLQALAPALYLDGDLTGARSALEEAVSIEEEAYGNDSVELAGTLATWARLELEAGEPKQAERWARRAIAIRRRAGPEKSRDLAATLEILAWSLSRLAGKEQLAEAEASLHEALAIERSLLGEGHPRTSYLLAEIAAVRARRGDFAGGEEDFLEALRTLRESEGARNPEVGVMLNNVAVFYHRQEKWPQAIDYYRQCLEFRREVIGEDHPLYGTTEGYLALALHMAGDDGAEATYRSALAHLLASRGESHEQVGNVRNDLGRLLLEEGRFAEAEDHLRQALAILQPIFGDEDQRTDSPRANLGYVLCRTGRVKEGEDLVLRSRAWRADFYGEDHWAVAEADIFQAACLAERGEAEAARELAERGVETLQAQRPAEHPTVRLALRIRDSL